MKRSVWSSASAAVLGALVFGVAAQGCGGKSGGNGFVPTVTLTITTTTLPAGTVGLGYSQQVQASGGVTPLTWSIQAGSLPGGLTLNPANGTIAGTPTTAGTFNFTVRVLDTAQVSAQQALSIVINAATGGGGGTSDFTVTVGAGTTPTYSWTDSNGRAFSVTVVRVSNPTVPVWGISTPGQDNLVSPVTHGVVPAGAVNTANTEPTLTAGVQYRVSVSVINGSRTGFIEFTP